MILFTNRFRFTVYLVLFIALCHAASPAGAEQPHDTGDVIKIIKKARYFGGRGFGYNNRSLDELSEKLRPADAPILIGLLHAEDYTLATGASFGLAALCDTGAEALAQAIANDDSLPLDRARDSFNMMLHFSKCTAETRSRVHELAPAIDTAFQRRMEKHDADRRAAEAALVRHNTLSLKLLDPEARKTLTPEERQEIFDANVKSLHLGGKRDADQEKLYQMMKKSILEP